MNRLSFLFTCFSACHANACICICCSSLGLTHSPSVFGVGISGNVVDGDSTSEDGRF